MINMSSSFEKHIFIYRVARSAKGRERESESEEAVASGLLVS